MEEVDLQICCTVIFSPASMIRRPPASGLRRASTWDLAASRESTGSLSSNSCSSLKFSRYSFFSDPSSRLLDPLISAVVSLRICCKEASV
jgi:hypothetical protein